MVKSAMIESNAVLLASAPLGSPPTPSQTTNRSLAPTLIYPRASWFSARTNPTWVVFAEIILEDN